MDLGTEYSIGPVHVGRGGEFFKLFKKSKKSPLGKEENKTHSKFYRDQMNGSWFQIGRNKVGGPVHGGV